MEKEINDNDRVGWTSSDNVKMEGFALGVGVGPKEELAIIGIDQPSEFYGRVVWLPTSDLTLLLSHEEFEKISGEAEEEDEDEGEPKEEDSEEPEQETEGYF